MKKIGEVNNFFDTLFNKTPISRCSYFNIFEPQIEDLMNEYQKCFSYYIKMYEVNYDLINVFYCIFCHLTNECLHLDITKARQFFDESIMYIDNNESLLKGLILERIFFDDIVSQRCKYFVKEIELTKEDHTTFISILKNTESVSLPIFLKQCISIKISLSRALKIDKLEQLEIKNLKEAIENLEKNFENDGMDKCPNFFIVTVHGSSDISCGRISDCNWDRTAFGSDHGTILIADMNGKSNRLFSHSMTVTDVEFTCQSDRIISCSLDGTVKVWNEESLESIQTYDGHYFPVLDICTNPQIDACFASGAMDGCVCIWDANRENAVRKLVGHLGPVKTVLFYKSGQYLASGGDDGQMRLWDMRAANCVRLWEATDGSKGIEALAFSEKDNEIVCGTEGGLVEWVGLEGGSCVSLHLEETVSTLLCQQRDRVIAGTINGGVYVLDQSGSVSRECNHQFSRIFNIQAQAGQASQVLILREFE